MRIDTISTFPGMFSSVMGESMMKRAQTKGILQFHAHDLRDWTHDRHRTTDDYPYGGGIGLVMKCEPIFEALEEVLGLESGSLPEMAPKPDGSTAIVFPAPHGSVFDDEMACELADKNRIVFVCGHYEGIDERAFSLATHIVSIGDYVLTGGELAAMVITDAVVRKLPGVLGADGGAEEESFSQGLLEYPQYTRPSNFRGMDVPEVLVSGHHARISEWQRHAAIERTAKRRPDIVRKCLDCGLLSDEDVSYLESLSDESLPDDFD